VGKVSVTMKLMPTGLEVDLVKLQAGVRAALGSAMKSVELKPVAFGLNAVMATAILDDASGGAEALEQKLAALSGVESVETVDVTLI